ncbi:MAG TPA: glycosyltransferase family 2 protein [Gemmataceae bacterium]|jgi:cellulose synthase/poly-beta-1,6-N-acetylglucosamine synthase-like glycosyltransferase|nr:glycosyltransferase family 2 protein [Gemmataceae bacterium]
MDSGQALLAVCFWVCLAAVLYAYVGYPLLVWFLARWFGRVTAPPPWSEDDPPTVSLLIAAHNEEADIGQRLEDALAADYPLGRLEVVVASDGSTDRTDAIVRRYADRGVRLLAYRDRQGKANALNRAMAQLTGDIVVLSDANTETDTGAVRQLARWFADPSVGVVCGRLVLVDANTGRNVDGMYWKYENHIKKCEGRLGALLGSNGAIYAIRRELFRPLPAGTIIDDFVAPLQAKMRTGCRIVYDHTAVAREETPTSIRAEFGRRCRIGAGAFQCLPWLAPLLHPRHGWLAFAFFSHKVLRWLCPFFLLGALAANAALAGESVYAALLLGQVSLYTAAALGPWLPLRPRMFRPLRLPAMFVSMNAALFIGFLRWLRGNQNGTWRRTDRTPALAKPLTPVEAMP